MKVWFTRYSRRTGSILLLALLLGSGVGAQTLTVTRVSDLQFGTMFPGVPVEVDKSAPEALEFLVTGTAGAEVRLDFSLPAYMNVNGHTIQLIFYDNVCAVDTSATPNQSSPPFDDLSPHQTLTYRIGSAGLTVWLGGKAIPGLKQAAGTYTGDVVLTAEYTGN